MRRCFHSVFAAWILPFAAVPADATEPPIRVVPGPGAAVPAPVAALEAPSLTPFCRMSPMAVAAATDEVQAHVNLGMHHLHGGWEFEAVRHFAAALKGDPDCLLAHWGMAMALMPNHPEQDVARQAALARMRALADAEAGTALERAYVEALEAMLDGGAATASAAFAAVADRYPNDLHASVFAAMFGRGGYNELGEPVPAQAAAERRLEGLIAKHPDSVVPLHAWLMIRAEAPDVSGSLAKVADLKRLAPEHAPFRHLAGHYLWRAGRHAEAAEAFAAAERLYRARMEVSRMGDEDAPERLRAEVYRLVAEYSQGPADAAFALAVTLSAMPIPQERLVSPGTRFLLWEVKTLPARMYLAGGLDARAAEAAASLPAPADLKRTVEASLAYWWIDGLRFAVEVRKRIGKGELDAARAELDKLGIHQELMQQRRRQALEEGEISEWLRAMRGLELISKDLRGQLAMAGPPEGRGSAFNWFSSAADLQRPASLLLPPVLPVPMAARLAGHHLAVGEHADAIVACKRALAAFPNDRLAQELLKQARAASPSGVAPSDGTR